jgi:hypothetical protein
MQEPGELETRYLHLLYVDPSRHPEPSKGGFGDSGPWTWWVPSVWHVLADPGGQHLLPTRPGPETEHFETISWWAPILHLLVFSLGWRRPDHGLRWWFDAGRPTEDARLELLDRGWGEHLGLLAAWLWTEAGPDLAARVARATKTDLPDAPVLGVPNEWLIKFHNVYSSGEVFSYTPWGGGTDPMHLANHVSSILDRTRATKATMLRGTPASRRAVLIVDTYAGWYAELHRLGRTLPQLPGDRSWHVDVLCRPIGWLGTYRRSRQTGRWFAGQHRYHQRGL